MPFINPMHPFRKENIDNLNSHQYGIYGIFSGQKCIFIGKGDIKISLLAHLDGDNPCIFGHNPTSWTSETIPSDASEREKQLIAEYNPVCNKKNSLI